METTQNPDAQAQHHGYHADKSALERRLKRIEGQFRGVAKMVDDDKYCIDILTQISAINAALHKVSVQLIDDHIGHCVVDAAKTSLQSGDPSVVQDKIAEATAAISRLVR